MHSRVRAWSTAVAMLALVAPMANECDPNTWAASNIYYEQIGACNGTPTSTGAVTAGPDAVYLAFRINRIENTMEHARDFTFDPNRLYINEDPRAYVNTTYATSMENPFATHGTTVAKGTTATVNGAVFVVVYHPAVSGDTVEHYNLLHDTPEGEQGAFLVREGPDGPYPYRGGCHELSY